MSYTHTTDHQQKLPRTPMLQSPTQEIRNFKESSPHTQLYLDKLQEEAAEIIQAVSKIRRFGQDSRHPDRNSTNLQELVGELEDFLALLACLEANKLIDLTHSQERIGRKFQQIYQG